MAVMMFHAQIVQGYTVRIAILIQKKGITFNSLKKIGLRQDELTENKCDSQLGWWAIVGARGAWCVLLSNFRF